LDINNIRKFQNVFLKGNPGDWWKSLERFMWNYINP